MGKWISVTKKLPEIRERVKVKGTGIGVNKKGYTFEGEDIFLGTTWYYRTGNEITHWKSIEKHTQTDIDNLNGWVN